MQMSKKSVISAAVVILFSSAVIGRAGAAGDVAFPQTEHTKDKDTDRTKEPQKTLTVWYTGEENGQFFLDCADGFKEETGIAVTVKEQPSLNYFKEIYDAVRDQNQAPDVYLLEADDLEQAYYAQIAETIPATDEERGLWSTQAVTASTVGENLCAYPLYFKTCLFAYRTDYLENEPQTIQEILDYAVEHEPGEGVEKLLEWNLSDAFYNFPFFGNAVSFQEEEPGTVTWNWDEAKKGSADTFFANLTALIELDENAVSEKSVRDDFKNGTTVAVVADTDSIENLISDQTKITTLPGLNGEIPMVPAAETTVLCVNALSEDTKAAEAFAAYVSENCADRLTDQTGHMPVRTQACTSEVQKMALEQYEKAIPEPDALDSDDFWVKFQNQVLQIWNGES